MKVYVVVWHEDNGYGVPIHTMGTSKMFFDKSEAKKWIDLCVAEDKQRAEDREEEITVYDPPSDSDVNVITETDGGRTCFYAIKELYAK